MALSHPHPKARALPSPGFLFLLVLLAIPAAAQEYTPVDQAVADLDPLATSMRDVRQRIDVTGYRQQLYQVQADGPLNLNAAPTYIRVEPGVSAQINRGVDYLVKRGRKGKAFNIAPQSDGEYIEMVPPNTVFILKPIDMRPPVQYGVDHRINAKIDTKLDCLVDGRAYQSPGSPEPGTYAPNSALSIK